MGTLKRNVCFTESVRLLWRGRACGVSQEFIVSSLAGAGERSSPGMRVSAAPTRKEGRGGKDKIQRNSEVLQKRVRILKMGNVAITGIYARVPRFESRLFCPARHACRNSRSRSARMPRNRFPLCNPRAVLEIKDNRLPLHKRPVSTYPFPLLSAFLQPSISGERSDSPRPCLKKQGRRGGAFPWGGSSLPEGRAFRIPFPSLGKVSPARGAHIKQFLIAKNHKQNFNASP